MAHSLQSLISYVTTSHRLNSIQIPHYLSSLIPMLLFVYYNIKFYNVRERRVHLTKASPTGCVHKVHCIL